MGGHLDVVKVLLNLAVDVFANAHYPYCKNCAPVAPQPGYGTTALHIVLDTGLHYRRQGKLLSEKRLQIAQLLVSTSAMVQDVFQGMMDLEDRLKFEKFPELWGALVAGDKVD